MLLSNAVVVDFDGFLVEHEFPEIGPLKEGAREFLENLRRAGYKIIISSCRNNAELRAKDPKPLEVFQDIETFMQENNLPYDWIDDGKNGKPIGLAYCDDRNVPYYNHYNSELCFEQMLHYIQAKFPVRKSSEIL